jgi:hypothetical protein
MNIDIEFRAISAWSATTPAAPAQILQFICERMNVFDHSFASAESAGGTGIA